MCLPEAARGLVAVGDGPSVQGVNSHECVAQRQCLLRDGDLARQACTQWRCRQARAIRAWVRSWSASRATGLGAALHKGAWVQAVHVASVCEAPTQLRPRAQPRMTPW